MDLVKQILAFARQSKEDRKPMQVDIIAKEVVKFIRSTIPSTIEVRQDIRSRSLIMGSPTQLHQILMNLCTNAAQAMEDEGGVLKVGLEDVVIRGDSDEGRPDLKPGNYVMLSVSDTGCGIPKVLLGAIFEPYFTTKDIGEGTGMGLALVHGIVESYGGSIGVESESGKGTTFSIYLPATERDATGLEYEKEPLPAGTENILLVDDEMAITRIGAQILQQMGYSVTTRTSSVKALELFRANPDAFDLVITDTTMPYMPGDVLAVELIKIRSDIPIILCTGYSKRISEESAKKCGVRALAYKPIVRTELVRTVRQVLDAADKPASS
jgi:CheY-like chemotaxis protein/two-component sensor histidine kinase